MMQKNPELQLELAGSARQYLEANQPWEAAAILERLISELSQLPVGSAELILVELASLQLLSAQGLDLSSNWLHRLAPSGSSYDAGGKATLYDNTARNQGLVA